MEVDATSGGTPGVGPFKRSDPYEFDDDGSAPSMEGFKRAPGQPVKVKTSLHGCGIAKVAGVGFCWL